MRLADLGEFGFIERIRERTAAAAGVHLGIGDDCAATESLPGELALTSTDMLIEGVHFRCDWTDFDTLGRKCVAVNVSDVAAMGGRARHLVLGLGVPADIEMTDLEALVGGFIAEAREYGAELIGGDTCRSPGPLLISVTVQGTVPTAQLVGRHGARPGDLLFVSGTLGDSALALRDYLEGGSPDPFLAARHHHPTARQTLGRALAEQGLARAMIDISDGLLADLNHLLTASGTGACVDAASLPLSDAFRNRLEREAALIELALSGGEDYELLFAVTPAHQGQVAELARRLALPLTHIGKVTAACTVELCGLPEGMSPSPRRGFDHFGAAGQETAGRS